MSRIGRGQTKDANVQNGAGQNGYVAQVQVVFVNRFLASLLSNIVVKLSNWGCLLCAVRV